jgi:hypothetical protein
MSIQIHRIMPAIATAPNNKNNRIGTIATASMALLFIISGSVARIVRINGFSPP